MELCAAVYNLFCPGADAQSTEQGRQGESTEFILLTRVASTVCEIREPSAHYGATLITTPPISLHAMHITCIFTCPSAHAPIYLDTHADAHTHLHIHMHMQHMHV